MRDTQENKGSVRMIQTFHKAKLFKICKILREEKSLRDSSKACKGSKQSLEINPKHLKWHTKKDTIFMNSSDSKTNEPYRFYCI